MESENILRILFVEDLSTDVELAVRVLKKNQLDFIYKRVETKEDFLDRKSTRLNSSHRT